MLRPFAIITGTHLVAILLLAACVKRDVRSPEAAPPASVEAVAAPARP